MSTYAQSIDFLLSQVRTSAGALTGGSVYAYAAGTDELKIIWLDRAKTLQAANPYTLDGNGTAALFGDGLYRILIKTSAGVTVYDRDNIQVVDPASGVDDAIAAAVSVYVVGYTTGCDTLAAAVATIGSTRATLQFGADLTIAGNISIPSNIELLPVNGAKINHGAYTIAYLGSTARWPLAQIFNGTGAITYGPNTPWDHPEWYGAVADAATDGSGTDSTVALQKSFNCATPTKLSSGNYLFSNLTLPTLKTVVGTGIHSTNLIAKTGSTGTAITEQGYAAKITLREFAVYGRDQAYTGGLKLGYTLGGTGVFGTEGLIDNVWVRDFPAGFPGIDINANVGQFGRIMAQSTGGVQIIGTGNMVGHVESMQSRGFTVTRYDATTLQAACNFQDTQIGAIEVEATDEGVVPIYFSGNTHISSVYLAPTAGATHPHLIEMDPSSTTWKIDNLKFYFHVGDAPIITNGNIKSGSTYFGGNASGKSYAGQGNYSSDMWLAGNTFAVANQKLQSFVLSIANNTSTLQHRFQDTYGTGAATLDDMITDAAYAWNNTPTGTDASTAFVAGGKIGSASTNTFWLDTPNAQITANCLTMAAVQLNSCGTALTVVPAIYAIDVNGTSKARLCLQFYNAATGAAYPLTTANIADGKTIQVLFMGFLR